VRWYPDTDPATAPRPHPEIPGTTIPAFFEVKDRMGAARDKLHTGFRMDGTMLQYAPPYRLRSAKGNPATGTSHERGHGGDDRATISIRYYRYRLVCPITRTRISLDTRLVSDRCNPDLMPGTEPRHIPQIVCEAKSPMHRHWPWSETLFRLGFRSCSFSKREAKGGAFSF
jgi:hypothetical protein